MYARLILRALSLCPPEAAFNSIAVIAAHQCDSAVWTLDNEADRRPIVLEHATCTLHLSTRPP